MTPEGYKEVNEALAGIEGITVSPVPDEGEDLRRVTIEIPAGAAHEEVLEALGKKALLLKDIKKVQEESGPALSLRARGPNNGGRVSLEFDDMAATQDSN